MSGQRVLVLGGTGFVGRAMVRRLLADGHEPVVASRRAGAATAGVAHLACDVLDAAALAAACADVDAVVSSFAGGADVIRLGARHLAAAVQQSPRVRRVVHLSSMAVYGGAEGVVTESTSPVGPLGWYGESKLAAEAELATLVPRAGLVVLRPGCVVGPGSTQWVLRIARLVAQGRLGDLGAAGDGWSNIVHVDDVAAAVSAGLGRSASGEHSTFNLALPGQPRWNDYFMALAHAIGALPVRRIPGWQLKLDARVLSVGLKVAGMASSRLLKRDIGLPEVLPPSLLRLFSQQIYLDSGKAAEPLIGEWNDVASIIGSSVQWYDAECRGVRRASS